MSEVVYAKGPRGAFTDRVLTLPDLEDRLAKQALDLAGDVRDDLGRAHRTVRDLSHLELEQLCVVLAAMVDVNVSVSQMAWWRTLRVAS